MPIFQDHDQPAIYTSRSTKPYQFEQNGTNDYEERARAGSCEDHLVESPNWSISEFKKIVPANNGGRTHTSDRAELIERIKRGESPTWVPKQSVCKNSAAVLVFSGSGSSMPLYEVFFSSSLEFRHVLNCQRSFAASIGSSVYDISP